MGFDANEIHTTDNLYLLAESGEIVFRDTGNAGVILKNGGTQFMDASRNLTNIGTISSGVITWTDGSSTNANTAYTYSQVGHLPLSGGSLTGNLSITNSTPAFFWWIMAMLAGVALKVKFFL